MKRTILLLLLLRFPQLMIPAAAVDESPSVSAASMILLHPESGRVLLEKNADDRRLIASTTKLLTALTALTEGDLDREMEIRPEWTCVEGSSMYLKAGEIYTLRELLTGLLLASGNDAALAIAEGISGSVQNFTDRMNALAGEIGMNNSHFSNPHGLDAEDHYSTARDLAVLMSRVMEEPVLREILALRSCRIRGREYMNHNKLLSSCPGVVAGKTGYTMAAGRCLVTCCERDGLSLICVTLSDRDDWQDHSALYDWAYDRFRPYAPSEGELPTVPVVSGLSSAAGLTVGEDRIFCTDVHEKPEVRAYLPTFVFAPVRRGEQAGTMVIRIGEAIRYVIPLYWRENIPAQSLSGSD